MQSSTQTSRTLVRRKTRGRRAITDDPYGDNVIVRGSRDQKKLILMKRTEFKPYAWNKSVLLDESFEKCENPPGLKVQLMDHQRTIVKAMMDMERIRSISLTDGVTTVETSAGVLTEKFGSGKTMMIISLILFGLPAAYPEIMILKDPNGNAFQCHRSFKEVLRPSIIFVGPAVLNQWEKEINTHAPSLKVFKVEGVYQLRELREMVLSREINKYDIIIVKNGRITGSFAFDELSESLRKQQVKPIVRCISHMIRGYCFTRVILDDFDTIQLPTYAESIPAIMTWFVSATRRHVKNVVPIANPITYVADVLEFNSFNYNAIPRNSELYHYFKVQNKTRYTDESVQAGKPNFWRYRFVNPNAAYIDLIGAMEGADDVMALINADAIETAADRAGIKTDKVSDIFQKLLGDKYDIYKRCVELLDFIDENVDGQTKESELPAQPEDEPNYGRNRLYRHEEILYKYPGLLRIMIDVEKETTEAKEKASGAIERVKDNLEQGECDICMQSFDQAGVVILPCCTGIFCHSCTMKRCQWYRNGQVLKGKCQKCRKSIGFSQLIFLNLDLDLDKIMDEDLTDDAPPLQEIVEEEEEMTEEEKYKIGRVDGLSKLEVMVDIIKGVDRYMHKKCANIRIPSLIEGTREMPPPTHRKVMVFADVTETVQKIREHLDKSGIKYENLEGKPHQLFDVVERFKKIPDPTNPEDNAFDVLIVQAARYCSGLNLQFTSDLIFFHRILDSDIEAQIAGRIQRIGRTTSFDIHYLLYENEDRSLNM